MRSLLQRHFDAINTRNDAGWRDTVVPERAERLAEPAWQEAYARTLDGTVRVDRIDDGARRAVGVAGAGPVREHA